MADNVLYYGDNLHILRHHIADESVNLVYLDPPFQSSRNYNVLFEEKDGTRAAAQIQAFEDTWRWDMAAAEAFQEIVTAGGAVSEAMQAFKKFLGHSDMLAYLSMMAPRLVELRRVLKPDGSLYLHCDPTASHYLKMLLDAVFGPDKFRSEIVWKRSSAHSDTKQGRKIHGHIHDILLFYTKGDDWTWNPVYQEYDQSYIDDFYRHTDKDGRRFRISDLSAAKPGGDTEYEWRVKRKGKGEWEGDLTDEYLEPRDGWEYKGVPPYKGRFWAYSKENMRAFEQEGRLYYASTGMPNYKRFLDEMPGVVLQDIWTDVSAIGSGSSERLGYPTQKPLALLQRIVESSSNEGDVVLDPFCGCGTTIDAAQRLGRKWIGIDITHLAITLIKKRLLDVFGDDVSFDVEGEPVTLSGATALAEQDRYQFEWWALDLVGAQMQEQKKGADKGIDGRIYFIDREGEVQHIIVSVKSGKPKLSELRDLRGVIDREDAAIGVLITLQEPTAPMRKEAASGGFYVTRKGAGDEDQGQHPRLQILTIEELLDGKRIDYPRLTGGDLTFRSAKRAKEEAHQHDLLEE